jgi:hypothetical protein
MSEIIPPNKQTKPVPEGGIEVVNLAAKMTMPVINSEHKGGTYFPMREKTKVEDYSQEQLDFLEWLQFQSSFRAPQEVVNSAIIHNTINLDGEKFKAATVPEKYLILKAVVNAAGQRLNAGIFRRYIERWAANGLLGHDQETELIATQYSDRIYTSIFPKMAALNLVRGVITSNSYKYRLLYRNEESLSYSTLPTMLERADGTHIARMVGDYTYRDLTLTPFSVIVEIDDQLKRDVTDDIMGIEVEKQANTLRWLANYELEKKLYDSAGADSVSGSDAPMLISNLMSLVANVMAYGYTPTKFLTHHTNVFQGLMLDTTYKILQAQVLGSTDIVREAALVRLLGIDIFWETAGSGFSYWRATADSVAGVITDPNYAGVFVQRFPPIMEGFRVAERQASCTSITWQWEPGLLYSKAISAMSY